MRSIEERLRSIMVRLMERSDDLRSAESDADFAIRLAKAEILSDIAQILEYELAH